VLVGAYFRKVFYRMPIEQILLTKISRREIVHAVCIRPLATQSTALIFMVLSQMALVIAAYVIPTQIAPRLYYGMAVVAILAAYYIAGACAEIGGAMALRCQLFIQNPQLAFARFVRDFLLSELGLPLSFVMFINVFFTLLFGPGAALFFLTIAIAAGGTTIATSGRTVIRDCGDHSQDWWYFRQHLATEPTVRWMVDSWDRLLGQLRKHRENEERNSMRLFRRKGPFFREDGSASAPAPSAVPIPGKSRLP
jgi:hypothetical protein